MSSGVPSIGKVRLLSAAFAGLVSTELAGSFASFAAIALCAPLLGDVVSGWAKAVTCFILPFALLAGWVAFFVDKYSKRAVILGSRMLQVLALFLALLCAAGNGPAQGSPVALMAILFLVGAAAALFVPAKYGVIVEIVEESDLSKANGVILAAMFAAISLGLAVGGYMAVHWAAYPAWSAGIVLAVAGVGLCTSLLIPALPAAAGELTFPLNPLDHLWRASSTMGRSRPLYLTVLGIGYFWFLVVLVGENARVYATQLLELDPIWSNLLLSVLATGVGLGCLLAAVLSAGKVELGLVPLGSIGLGIFSLLLFWSHRWPAAWGSTANLLFGLGLCAGLFHVPLVGLLQIGSPRQRVGGSVAAGNFVLAIAVLAALALLPSMIPHGRLSPDWVFLFAGLITLGVTIYVCWLLPEFLFRLLFWMITHTIYRIRVLGRENVPSTGPGLLVCNHVSYADGFFIVASHHRLIRFVVWGGFANSPYLRWLSRIMGVIPISAADGPKALAGALRAARDALRNGELVCMFAEGQISRIGNLLRFKRGFERVVHGVEAPLIPVYLDCVWGSIFSFQGGRFLWKWPKQFPYPITVGFGRPLPATAAVYEVRQAVQELGADCVRMRKSLQKPLHRYFIRVAARHPFRFCMADTRGTELTYGKVLAGIVALSRVLRRQLTPAPMVGVLLPPSVGGSLANLALLAAGKIPINLNYTASSEAVASCIAQCGIDTIISSPEVLKRVRIALPFEPMPIELLRQQISRADRLWAGSAAYLLPGWITDRWLLGLNRTQMDDLVTVIFSSGSTGEPKGVMLSHHNVMSNCEAIVQVIDPTSDDHIVGLLPLFHSFGFLANLWVPFLVGAAAVYHSNPLDSREVGELTAKYGGTILLATPTFLRAYTRKIPREQCKTLRLVIAGAEKLPQEVAQAFREKFGIEPLEGYGCTELSPVVAVNIPNFIGGDGVQIGNKPGTVGHPLPGVAVRVVDPDSGAPLPPGQDGLLLVKGPNVMQGYLGKPELTAQVIRDGWYVTGDIAQLDEDGFITITDRLSRFSKIGGEMVPHVRVEEAIRQVLGTEEQVAAVVGLPDPSRGERLVVLHTPLPISADQLWRRLNAAELPKLWVPARDSFYEVPELPYLGTGKLDLRRIKQMALELVGAGQPMSASRAAGGSSGP